MNDFKKNITYQTTKLQKKTKTGSENENEIRRHVPLPVVHYLRVSSSGRGMGLFDVGVCELGDDAGVGFSVVGEGAGVGAAGRHVDLFGRWFGIVDGLRHPCGHKIIGSAMNHEHREVGFFHLLDG